MVNCVLVYMVLFNIVVEVSGVSYLRNAGIFENFNDWYKYWGYLIEGVFRMVAMFIAWRCYQFSEMIARAE